MTVFVRLRCLLLREMRNRMRDPALLAEAEDQGESQCEEQALKHAGDCTSGLSDKKSRSLPVSGFGASLRV